MAGVCHGLGLGLDAAGNLQIAGAVSKAWPNQATCRVQTANGLKVDPVTGNAWVAPERQILTASTTSSNRNLPVTDGDSHRLTLQELTMTCPPCVRGHVQFVMAHGYIGQRLASGNWWYVTRLVNVYRNGSLDQSTGWETVAAAENNSGGVLGVTTPVETRLFRMTLQPGESARISTDYMHARAAYTGNAANDVDWRPPQIVGTLWTLPA